MPDPADRGSGNDQQPTRASGSVSIPIPIPFPFPNCSGSGSGSGSEQYRASTGKGAYGGVPGTLLCRINHPAPRRAAHNGAAGLPRETPRGQFSRLRWRPPLAQSAWSTPSTPPPNDHADCATLGRQGRPRRPEMTEPSSVSRPRSPRTSQKAGDDFVGILRLP